MLTRARQICAQALFVNGYDHTAIGQELGVSTEEAVQLTMDAADLSGAGQIGQIRAPQHVLDRFARRK